MPNTMPREEESGQPGRSPEARQPELQRRQARRRARRSPEYFPGRVELMMAFVPNLNIEMRATRVYAGLADLRGSGAQCKPESREGQKRNDKESKSGDAQATAPGIDG